MPKRFDRSNPADGQPLFRSINLQVPAATTYFFNPAGSGANALNEAEANGRLPLPRRVKNAVVITQTAQPGTGSLVLTLRKNGADTALQITIPAGAAAGTFRDDTNGVDLDVGDNFCWKAQNNAPAALSATVNQLAYALE